VLEEIHRQHGDGLELLYHGLFELLPAVVGARIEPPLNMLILATPEDQPPVPAEQTARVFVFVSGVGDKVVEVDLDGPTALFLAEDHAFPSRR
jgi:hypothetical protein